ncbi:MAG: VWA domain-containing protein [Deltaproteobacteria bacterium]|nr:VWA domain-containing protein [Deltaproteobacteria bacterium]
MPVGMPEFVDNPEHRCPVVLVLDTSGSMDGAPIEALNQGIQAFKDDVEKDEIARLRVEVAVVTFGGTVQLVQDFVTIDQFIPPVLMANGGTPMGEAIQLALDKLEDRKLTYKSNGIQYFRPWVFLITDGSPTDAWQQAAARVHQAEIDKRVSFYAVGVAGADLGTLAQIAPPSRAPMSLQGLNFRALFQWLSASMQSLSIGKIGGQMVALPPITGWAQTST